MEGLKFDQISNVIVVERGKNIIKLFANVTKKNLLKKIKDYRIASNQNQTNCLTKIWD